MANPLTPIGVAPPAAPAGGVAAQVPVPLREPRPAAAVPPAESQDTFLSQGQATLAPQAAKNAQSGQSPLQQAAEEVKAYLAAQPSQVQYEKDEDLDQIVIKLLNPATKEVIRQIPSEEIVALAKKLRQLSQAQDAKGVLLDEQG